MPLFESGDTIIKPLFKVIQSINRWDRTEVKRQLVLFDLLSLRNVCATEYAEVCEERVATRLEELLALV